MSTPVILVVALFLVPGREEHFSRFESSAVEIMRRHGGSIERRIRATPGHDPSHPDEIHIVTFPDEESFARYRQDPSLLALQDLRATAIRDTIIWPGIDAPPFE